MIEKVIITPQAANRIKVPGVYEIHLDDLKPQALKRMKGIETAGGNFPLVNIHVLSDDEVCQRCEIKCGYECQRCVMAEVRELRKLYQNKKQ